MIDNCGGTDQGLAMVHELSHINDVYSPPTQDFAYKYNDLVELPKEQAVLNADTYNLYAGGEFCFIPLPHHDMQLANWLHHPAIDLDCQIGESKGVVLPDWMVTEILNNNSN